MSIARKINLALLLFFSVLIAHGQPQKVMQTLPSNHVVIGAFASLENATHFTEDASKNHPEVKFQINPVRQLYYVYVQKTNNRVRAFAEARSLRKESGYWDTWVYYGILGESLDATSSGTEASMAVDANVIQRLKVDQEDAAADQIKAFSMSEEPTGLDLNEMVRRAPTKQLKDHYKDIQDVKKSASEVDMATKVIVLKDDDSGRQSLRTLGYEIKEGEPIKGFFDSRNNILVINATESQAGESFHEGLKPVINFLKKKNPEVYESFVLKATSVKHPKNDKTYGELSPTGEEALANMMADVAKGHFENSTELKGEATTLMHNILEAVGLASTDLALDNTHQKVTADNLSEAVLEAKAEEPTGLDLNDLIIGAKTQQQKHHYEVIQEVKGSVSKLDAATKVIVFKDDNEGRAALRSLGYDIEDDKPITGFFDSKNNILAINATESKVEEPFHEGLKPVVKFLKKKNPQLFETFAKQASTMKHPTKGKTYGELTGTDEEALGNMMADVANGYFDNTTDLKGEATTVMKKILESLGVTPPELALSSKHLKTTASNLAIAVREATGFDAEGNRKFRFNLYNTMNAKNVKGEVDLVNSAGKKLISYPGNEVSQVRKADASGDIILACEVLGYRKLLFKLNYDNPFLTEGVTRGDDGEAIIPFGLVRLQKGDIAVMYNVYFYRDAAIMRPESKYEINNLLAMMNENPAYKILIHGHTNGNAAGKIITMSESKNYFSLTDTKDSRGSAKKLSEERATVIRDYMVDQGISTDRMEIKAWGGKRPLYDKNHSLAQTNVRVEIEIIEN